MKKIIALVLALTMAFSMALTVSATEKKETFEVGKDSYTYEGVNVVITMSGMNVVHTYAFDVEYGSMEFTYGKIMTWDPETYQYKASGNGSDWHAEEGANKIKVVNHSDLPIICEAAASVNKDAGGEFVLTVDAGAEIEGCEVGDTPGDNYHDMFVTLSGVPHISSGNQVAIGQVSVTIKKVPTNNGTTNGGSNTGSNTGSTDGSNGEPTSNAQ